VSAPAKVAGVVIDTWKLPVFRRHLDAAGAHYTEHPGLTDSTLTLRVVFTLEDGGAALSFAALQTAIQAAQLECAKGPAVELNA
jgi:hypothetical protein